MSETIEYKKNILTGGMLAAFRYGAGWGRTSIEAAEKAAANSLGSVVAFDGEKPVGIGRLVGDGALVWYVQDIVVLKPYRRRGIGGAILEALISTAREAQRDSGAVIGLMSADGMEGFYEKYGFVRRPAGDGCRGSGMTMDL